MSPFTSERENCYGILKLDLCCTGIYKIKITVQTGTNIRLLHGEPYQTIKEVSDRKIHHRAELKLVLLFPFPL